MPTPTITESRLALVVSAIALLVTFWQGYEARKANGLNQEALKVEVQPSDIPSKRIEKVVCIDGGQTTVYLFWRVNVFNSSSQPVTVKDIFSMSFSPAGAVSGIGPISKDGPVDQKFPVVIEPKSFKTFLLSVPTLTSQPFSIWLREGGGCDSKFDWGSAGDRGGYSETGWPTARAVNAYFTVTTGDGNEFNAISNWP
ncbi:hypothetical protein KWH29_12545 [Xanthomonas campestris pv. paulliniae]|uniref:hypothetical protein n=1 Tax=Xanthomonas euvesicatoria TaxID=456327 RepID=UPI001C47C043|nr:hypothetical protein [Xanthomonas euvesicatoria]MBV6846169.1 hypothetical protein [Xanthomonas campestris pv. paulliniae]